MVKKLIIVITTFVLMGINAISVNAQQDTVSFSVNIVVPSSQKDSSLSYFDLVVSPRFSEVLKVEITNNENESIVARVDIVNGSTGPNGTPQYQKDASVDSSMKLSVIDLTTTQVEVIIPAKSKIIHDVNLDLNDNIFEGEIVGGIVVSAEFVNDDRKNGDGSLITFNNAINYLIGVRLRMSEEPLTTNLNLIGKGVAAYNYLPVFTAKIQNDQAFHMGKVEIEGNVKNESDKIVAKVNVEGAQILPNTNFDVHFATDKLKLEAGKYFIDLEIRHKDSVWNWKEEVVVENKDAEEVNEEVIIMNPEESFLSKYGIHLIVSGLMGVILFLLFIIFKREKEDDEEE